MRYWTEPEARAYLPRVRALLAVIRRATQLEVRARSNGHASMPGPRDHPGGHPSEQNAPDELTDTEARASNGDQSVDDAGADIDAESALRELDEEGIILRDPQRGLIDFPARHPNGRDVLLCWQLGEDDLAWWHLPEDGFAGRRPLPLPPDL